ncbi:MAG: hypothetical protein ABI977_27575 [Acidobacteriota bacterium]
MKRSLSQPSTPHWIQIVALCLTVLLIGFLISAYFITPQQTGDQRNLIRALYPLLAAFAAFFIGGTAFLFLDYPRSSGARVTISATAGLAVFLIVYFYPPYWFKAGDQPPTATPTPMQSAQATISPSPVPIITPSPVSAITAPSPSPRASVEAVAVPSPKSIVTSSQASTPSAPIPTPPVVARKASGVLLLIDDEVVARALMRKISDYGVDVTLGTELGGTELARIRAALDQRATTAIPFAVVVTGKISIVSLGPSQGAHIARASGILRAIVTASSETLRGNVALVSGGGQTADAALRDASQQAGENLPQLFISQVAARAR